MAGFVTLRQEPFLSQVAHLTLFSPLLFLQRTAFIPMGKEKEHINLVVIGHVDAGMSLRFFFCF